MAKSMTTAPKLTRISPGVYRDEKGKTVQSTTGKVPAPKKDKGKGKGKSLATPPTGPQYEADPNMSANQNAIQYGIEQGDMGLADAANGYIDDIQGMGNFEFNGPAQAQYNPEERKRIEDEVYARFERYDAPQRQQENDDLARWAQSTGNSVDSPAYAARAKQLADSQNARVQDARSQAVSQGLGEAQGQFEMSQNAHNTAYGEQLDQWGRPLQTFGAIRGQISPSWSQGQANSQNLGQIAAQGAQQRQTQKTPQWMPPRAGGGGGSGGGGGRSMTSAPQGYVPTYQGGSSLAGQGGSSSPSYWSQLFSSLGGPLIKAGAEKLGDYLLE